MNEMCGHITVALDVPSAGQVAKLIDELGDLVQCYKIGMDGFYRFGPTVLSGITNRNKKLFLDLKLHDIPTTVHGSIKALCQFSPTFISVHASGGVKMLKAAVQATEEWSAETNQLRPKIIAITVLTSISEQDWVEVGGESSVRESVLRMALMCKEAGVDGVIASPQECAAIRALCGPDFLIMTPGIRLIPEPNSDQVRTATPAQAIKAGADYLIIGRPIWEAVSPKEVVNQILDNLAHS